MPWGRMVTSRNKSGREITVFDRHDEPREGDSVYPRSLLERHERAIDAYLSSLAEITSWHGGHHPLQHAHAELPLRDRMTMDEFLLQIGEHGEDK